MKTDIKELLTPLNGDVLYLDLFKNFGKENSTLKKEDYLDIYELVDTSEILHAYLNNIVKELTQKHQDFYLKYLDIDSNDQTPIYEKYKYATLDRTVPFQCFNREIPKYSFKPYYFHKDGLLARYLYQQFKTNDTGLNNIHPFLYLDCDHFIFIDTSLYVKNNKLNIKNTLTLSTTHTKANIEVTHKDYIKENIKNINEITDLKVLTPYKTYLNYCLLDTLYQNPKKPLSKHLKTIKKIYVINELKDKEEPITEEIEEEFNKLFIYKVNNKYKINSYLEELSKKDVEIVENSTQKAIIISKKPLDL